MKYYIFLICTVMAMHTSAQNSMEGQQRWVYGGDIALAISNNTTIIGAAPTLGYRFTERLTAGGGFLYYYYRFRTTAGDYTTSIYGPSAFGRYTLANGLISEGDRLFFQSDYYLVNTEYLQSYSPSTGEIVYGRDWIPQWFMGGGYYTSLGGNVYGGLMVMWDVIGDSRAPFQNPMIRGGISIGI